MDKSEVQLFSSLKGSPDNQFFKNLLSLLEDRLESVKNDWMNSDDANSDIQKGRARELKHLISGLTRKSVKEQYTGSFN